MAMQNLLISFNAVMPMFLMIALGVLLKQKCRIGPITSAQMNNIVFHILLPALIFNNLYNTSNKAVFRLDLVLFAIFGILIVWILSIPLVYFVEKSDFKRGAMIQGIFRSNFTLFGMPLIAHLFGSDKIGTTSLMIAVVIPIFNILSIITLESFRIGHFTLNKILIAIMKNPMIILSLLGIVAMMTEIKLPTFVELTVASIANIATPLSLIIMGASLKIDIKGKPNINLAISIIARLILAPLIVLPLAVLWGFRDVELATLLAIFASPTAVLSYIMAEQMGSDGNLAAKIIVFTTLFSCLTIFLWIFYFKQYGMI